MSKRAPKRFYPPDYVSVVTLAYRLDCSEAEVTGMVRVGLLPKPQKLGTLERWDFNTVRTYIDGRNSGGMEVGINGRPRDAYLERLKRGTAA